MNVLGSHRKLQYQTGCSQKVQLHLHASAIKFHQKHEGSRSSLNRCLHPILEAPGTAQGVQVHEVAWVCRRSGRPLGFQACCCQRGPPVCEDGPCWARLQ